MCGEKYLSLNIVACCFFILAIPAIILLSLSPRENIVANTRGYIVPGGDCQIICGGTGAFSNCESVGIINVSFYPPGTSSQLISGLTEAPVICEYETTDMTICCQNFIEEQTLLWIQVATINGSFNVTHVSIHRTDNYSAYLIFGLILAVGSLPLGVACIYIIINFIKKSCSQSYTIVN